MYHVLLNSTYTFQSNKALFHEKKRQIEAYIKENMCDLLVHKFAPVSGIHLAPFTLSESSLGKKKKNIQKSLLKQDFQQT